MITRAAVVLPAPFGPSSTVTVPACTAKETSSSATTPLKARHTDWSSTTGAPIST